MKKYLAISTIFMNIYGTVATETKVKPYFNGAYIGIVGGMVRNNLEGEISALGITIRSKEETHVNGLLYGAIVGYGHNFNGFYVGGEVGVQSDTTNKNKDYLMAAAGVTGTIKAKYERGVVFSVAPRFGAVFADSCMIYAKPAVEISKDKIAATINGDTDSSKKKFKFVFVPAIGLEKAFSSSVLARLEYGYNFGTKFTTSDDEVPAHYSLKYTSHVIKVGISYQF